MGREIIAAKEYAIQIFDELKAKYKDYDFHFGSVFYRDKIDSKNDKDEYFDFTNNMKDLRDKISKIKVYGGADESENWVVGYIIALNNMSWREGIKLIIHISDAEAHGLEFTKGDLNNDQGPLLPTLIQKCPRKNINIIGFKISKSPQKII